MSSLGRVPFSSFPGEEVLERGESPIWGHSLHLKLHKKISLLGTQIKRSDLCTLSKKEIGSSRAIMLSDKCRHCIRYGVPALEGNIYLCTQVTFWSLKNNAVTRKSPVHIGQKPLY